MGTNTFASMAFELLCHLTFAPAGGIDPDDTNELVNAWWQTIIHDLDEADLSTVHQVMSRIVAELEARELRSPLATHQRDQLDALRSYLSGDMS